jgi:hypothetical protein
MMVVAKFEERGGDLYINGKKVLKGWESLNGWYWFGIEEVEPGVWFGYVQGLEDEWGYFDERELKSLGQKVSEISKKDLVFAGRRPKRTEYPRLYEEGKGWFREPVRHSEAAVKGWQRRTRKEIKNLYQR